MKRIGWTVCLALALLFAILSFNAWRAGPRASASQPRAGGAVPLAKVDSTRVAAHLAHVMPEILKAAVFAEDEPLGSGRVGLPGSSPGESSSPSAITRCMT